MATTRKAPARRPPRKAAAAEEAKPDRIQEIADRLLDAKLDAKVNRDEMRTAILHAARRIQDEQQRQAATDLAVARLRADAGSIDLREVIRQLTEALKVKP